MTSTRELLRAPLYGRWLAGRAVSWFGDTVMILPLSIWVKSLTGRSSQAGVTLAFFMAPQLLAAGRPAGGPHSPPRGAGGGEPAVRGDPGATVVGAPA